MLTDEQIKAAISDLFDDDYQPGNYDCVRIAYEWLDAQKKTKKLIRANLPLKHLIERWGGRFVSSLDVMVAARVHECVCGEYPTYNISSRLTFPSKSRLQGIASAGTQSNYDATCDIDSGFYKHFEADQ